MTTAHHVLKAWPRHYELMRLGETPFTIRDNSDRHFQKGDAIDMFEYDPDMPNPVSGNPKGARTGRHFTCVIGNVLSGWGLSPGHVCLALHDIRTQMDDPVDHHHV